MSAKHPPLKLKEVRSILKEAEFTLIRTRSSHEQWEGTTKGKRRVVSVDTNIRDFSGFILSNIIRQSGLSKDEFYELRD